jgi:hypothetical protein
MKRGEGEVGCWRDFGNEHQLLDDHGQLIARVAKLGCCWRGYLGASAMTSGRFRCIEDAKRSIEVLLTTVHA